MLDDQIVSVFDLLNGYKYLIISGVFLFYLLLIWQTARHYATYVVTKKIQEAHSVGKYEDEFPELTKLLRNKSIVSLGLNVFTLVGMTLCIVMMLLWG
ncbi:hypothetical protein N6B35_29330 (plasmid) [Klebsiella michiganensis]|uniref:hypothetical protein n=1 Tax=Klebsiella michiganensis TaxID=1134687 RepID=UPI0021DA3E96|nr:hypothetical protein [Klebsiella michiganensis]UYB60016.1 hypothetical protein N6B35_29330 [Klebsiella michiganensis]